MSVDYNLIREKQEFFDNAAAGWDMEFDDRDRALLDYMVDTFKRSLPGSNAPVLDIGCGTGVLFPYLNDIPFCGVDISYTMLSNARKENGSTGIDLCQADAHVFPFRNSSVAGIAGFAVLPHLDRHDVFLSECRRILIRGGILLIAHLRTAREINTFHQSLGGTIAKDHLPEAGEMAKSVSEYGFSIEINDNDDKYMLLARKL